MAQSYLQSLMGEHEQILFAAHQHSFMLVSTIFLEVVTILAIIVMVGLATAFFLEFALWAVVFGLLLFLIPLGTMMRDILNYSNRQYIITNRRVMQISGVFNKVVADSSLEKVNDVKLVQSALGRIFDYGDIEILTASELGINQFRRIQHPVRFKTAMLDAKNRMENPQESYAAAAAAAASVNIPALIAQLDGLRQAGLLSEEEFQYKKAQLLERM